MHHFNDLFALDHFTKHDVLAVEPGALYEGDKELAAIGVGTGIGHRQQVGLVMLELKVFISELLPVD